MRLQSLLVITALAMVVLKSSAQAAPGWLLGPFDNGTAPQGTNGSVSCATLWDPDGPNGSAPPTTVVGGSFTSITGVSAQNVAMLDPFTHRWVPIGEGTTGPCSALAVWNGYLIAAVGGLPGVAIWTGTHWAPFGESIGNAVYALAMFNGDLFVGGQFTIMRNGSVVAQNIARWDANLGQWQAVTGGGPGESPVQTVRCLVSWSGDLYAGTEYFTPQNASAGEVWRYHGPGNVWLDMVHADGPVMTFQPYNGQLVAAGAFSNVGGAAIPGVMAWDTYSWHALGSLPAASLGLGLAAWNGELVALGTFSTVSGFALGEIWNGASWTPIGTGFNGAARCGIPESSDLLVGGDFTSGPGGAYNRMARWDGSSWYPVGGGTVSSVLAMSYYGGRLVMAGNFHQSTPTDPEAVNIVAWDGNGFTSFGSGMDDQIDALCSYTFGSHINITSELVAGGYFLNAGGVVASRIARWDQGSLVIGGPAWQPMGDGFDSAVQAIERCTLNGTANTYAAGWFSWTMGATYLGHIGRWNSVSGAWEPMAGGTDGPIYALKYFNGFLYAGGAFSNAGGVSTGGLARWNGTAWSNCGGFFNGTVYALEIYNGQLVIGGSFPGINSSPNLAEYDGAFYSTFGTGGTNGAVTALHALGNKLYVGGAFAFAGGLPASYLAAWDGAWHDVDSGTDGTVYALGDQGGELDAGGLFGNVGPGSLSSPRMARHTDTGIPWLVAGPFSQTVPAGVTALFPAIVASGYDNLTERWLFGGNVVSDGPTGIGSTLTGTTGSTLSILNTMPGDAGDYRFIVSNASGADTSGAATLTVTGVAGVHGVPGEERTVFDALGPSPTRGASSLGFSLARSARVRFEVFDLAGRRFTALDLGELSAGRHQAALDLAAVAGRPGAGIYFITMAVDGRFTGSRRLVLLR